MDVYYDFKLLVGSNVLYFVITIENCKALQLDQMIQIVRTRFMVQIKCYYSA